jgi:hypothetical protein
MIYLKERRPGQSEIEALEQLRVASTKQKSVNMNS